MDYDLSALKVLFRKIFPPKKCVYTIDSTNDGKPDSILIRAFNVVAAFEIPKKIELGGFSTNEFDIAKFDLSDYGKMYLDDKRIVIAKNEFDVYSLKDHFTIYINKEKYSIDDVIQGKIGGKTIALGDSINILIQIDEDSIEKFTIGKHKFKLKSELIPTLEFEFELTEDNLNCKLDSVLDWKHMDRH